MKIIKQKQSLKEICEELKIPWTDDKKNIKNMVNNKIDEALYKEQREKDL